MEPIKLRNGVPLTGENYTDGDVNTIHGTQIAQQLPSKEVVPGWVLAFKMTDEEFETFKENRTLYYRVISAGFHPMNIMVINPLEVKESGSVDLKDFLQQIKK